jgi:hypothetical protein
MSEQNRLPIVSLVSIPDSTKLSPDENLLTEAPKSEMSTESDGSIGSRFLYGLGTLLFVLPMLLPGIPMNWLVVFYVGLMLVGIVGYLLWSAFSSLKTRWLRRG